MAEEVDSDMPESSTQSSDDTGPEGLLSEMPEIQEPEQLTPEEMEIQRTANQYLDRILELEAESGAYNNALVEQLSSLGLAYNNLGNHTYALDVFNRALHINRVNEGLHNINQLPILDQIIKTNTALNDYDALNKNHGYMVWVYGRNYDGDDLKLAEAYSRAANWQIDAFDITPPPDSLKHLIMAANYFSKSTDIVERAKGPDAPELINSLYGIVNANFKLVEPYGFVPNIDTFISGKLYPMMPSNFDSEFSNSPYPRNPYRALDYSPDHLSRIVQEEKYTFSLVQNAYKSGRNALIRIIEIYENNPDLPRISYAYALTHMGDWYLRFYKRSFAVENYQKAYQTLIATEYGNEAIEALFSRPRSLGNFEYEPEFEFERHKVVSAVELTDEEKDEMLDEVIDELGETKFALVEFNISRYGAVRNLSILASNPPDSVRFRRMARATVNSTPFRPRLENGQPITTENVKMLYRFQ
ncbi:MAG: hypothetical protein HKN08_06655 [Gammaproteobacteria bacterium]|nr:hypothetical protein [Gammaproteobacteria bacterium]